MEGKKYCIGIDFGTSNSCAGIYINRSVRIVPNKIGERITPSVVFFEDEKILAGEEALFETFRNDKNFINEVKRFIGLDYEEFVELGFDKSISYVVKNIDGKPKIEIENSKGEKKYYTAVEISSYIIKKIKKNIEAFINDIDKGTQIREAIFTVPKQFTDSQIKGVLEAAKIAGIEIPRCINEPNAAILAYGFGDNLSSKKLEKQEEKISKFNSTIIGADYEVPPLANQSEKKDEQINNLMVFDLGGGTLDISLLNLTSLNKTYDFEATLTDGDTHLGGSDFDKYLMNYCLDLFCSQMKINKNDLLNDFNAIRRLKIKCENAKKMLSIKDKTTILIDNFYKNENLMVILKKKDFLDICEPLYKRIKEKIDSILNEMNFKENDINYVILVGGGSKICGIKNLLISKFGEDKIKDDINQEEAVAIGATLYAAKLQGQLGININLQDIIPYNIGIGVKNLKPEEAKNGDIMHVIIGRYKNIPNQFVSKKYQTILNKKHPNIYVKVYEGNKLKSKYVKDFKKIGYFYEKNIKKEGTFMYKIVFDVDLNGDLTGELIFDSPDIPKIKYQSIAKISQGILVGKTISISHNNKLKTVAKSIEDIKNIKKEINNSRDFITKLNNLEECCKIYKGLIENFMPFVKNNENLCEKLVSYTNELFIFYLEMINPKNNKKEKISEIILDIKDRMNLLIKELDYVEELLKVFIPLRGKFNNEFYQIFINYMEILNNEGIKLSKGHFSRYYIKLYFEKVFFSKKKYVIEKDLYTLNKEIKENYDKQWKITDEGLTKANSYAYYVETMIKEGKFEPGETGCTLIAKKIEKINKKPTEKDIFDILDIFHNMADSFDHKENTIEEAYCLANIIIINYENLKVKDYDKLEKYIIRFLVILKKRKNIADLPLYKRTLEIIKELESYDN